MIRLFVISFDPIWVLLFLFFNNPIVKLLHHSLSAVLRYNSWRYDCVWAQNTWNTFFFKYLTLPTNTWFSYPVVQILCFILCDK
jgi:hypothetical protein